MKNKYMPPVLDGISLISSDIPSFVEFKYFISGFQLSSQRIGLLQSGQLSIHL